MNTNIEQPVHKEQGWPYWMKLIVVLCLGWTAMWIYRQTLPSVYPEMELDLGVSNTALGFIATCYFFSYTAMQIPAGILVDKFGQKVIMIPGFILFAIAPFLIAISTSINMIYFASILAGIGCGTYYGSAYSLSSQNIPADRRGLSTAIINSGSALGMAVALIGSSLLVKQMGMSWQTMMYISGAIIVIMVLVFAAVIKGAKSHSQVLATKKDIEVETEEDKEGVMKRLLAPKMLSIYFLYFGTCYGYYMIVTWLPKFLQSERGFEGVAVGFAASLVAFASIPGALLFSRLSDKFQSKKISLIVALELAAAIMLFGIISFTNETALLIALILYGLLGKLAVEPIIISYVADVAPKKGYGTTLGVFNSCGMASSVIAPPLTGAIIDSTNSQSLGFYVAVAVLVAGAVLFMLMNRKQTS
ncbi:MFS transporter [Wohlfahrtiimonas larvae]|uniref:MFS transporter n=1 Tax=Wohlfahrtiimonas larvae TaxID=1157986 RepID=A0ABP9MCP9_9GAMM|nr:MFS transporter [Wohlfahrtiimonas larvae]